MEKPDLRKPIRVAAVQAAPVFLNADLTTEKACRLIREAGAQGADVVGFPEGFIPSHPAWLELIPSVGDLALELFRELFHNAVEVPGPHVAKLQEACREAKTFAVVGVNERRPGTTGTLFNTQLFIGRDGALLHKHQKYVPTIGERLVHAPGQTGSRAAVPTDFGALSGLICGENSNPLAQYAIALDYPVVHVASWPQHFNEGLAMQEALLVASRGLAYSLKCFVLNCVAVLDDAAIDAYGRDEASRSYLQAVRHNGGASIVGPKGTVIATAEGGGEQLVYADVSANDLLIPKLIHDFAGHYNRPELFAALLQR